MAIKPPDQGFIFWPVGTGDSTTIRVADTVYVQLDLRHMAKSEDRDDPAWPVIDELIRILPTLDRRPYLSVFGLTHPDLDHCQGFEELKDRAIVSELWMSPRTFRESLEGDDLCDDAQAFHDEAMRRVRAAIRVGGDPGRGNRIRIIGYDDLLREREFRGFPAQFLTIPGQTITSLDGQDLSHRSRHLSTPRSVTTASVTATTAASPSRSRSTMATALAGHCSWGTSAIPSSGGSSTEAPPRRSPGMCCSRRTIARNPPCTGRTKATATKP